MRFTSEITADLVECNASDEMVVRAARVSTGSTCTEGADKLIAFLLKNRHGSPFEHTFFTWKVSAPIFVWREHMRHRIGFSYNEESGRYKQLEPVFYVPPADRDLVQVGKAGAYTFEPGTEEQYGATVQALESTAVGAYREYEYLLGMGVAREVARMCLPLNIYSTAFVTMNARALMNFLSLRTTGGYFPSYPQREIEVLARQYERDFAAHMPATYAAFDQRIAP